VPTPVPGQRRAGEAGLPKAFLLGGRDGRRRWVAGELGEGAVGAVGVGGEGGEEVGGDQGVVGGAVGLQAGREVGGEAHVFDRGGGRTTRSGGGQLPAAPAPGRG